MVKEIEQKLNEVVSETVSTTAIPLSETSETVSTTALQTSKTVSDTSNTVSEQIPTTIIPSFEQVPTTVNMFEIKALQCAISHLQKDLDAMLNK